MTANLSPIFTLAANIGTGVLNTADPSPTAPSAAVTILTAGANGTMVERVSIQGTASTAPGLVRLFLYDGTNYRLYEEILINAVVSSTTVLAFMAASARITPATPLVLPSGWSLRATTTITQSFVLVAEGGDF